MRMAIATIAAGARTVAKFLVDGGIPITSRVIASIAAVDKGQLLRTAEQFTCYSVSPFKAV